MNGIAWSLVTGADPSRADAGAPNRGRTAERSSARDAEGAALEGRGRTRRRVDLAAFPAVFLSLLGAPAEAEMPRVPVATPVGVPAEDAALTLDLLEETAAALARDLDELGVDGAAAAAAFAELQQVIAAALAGPLDPAGFTGIVHDFRAALDAHAETVAAVVPNRVPAEAAADTLGGWGFLPDFQTRLQRVVERMRSEHGHDVQVIEGYRNQQRQDDLWGQGRTRPGPVVTWTQESRHTAGAAADLLIDGDWVQGRPALLLQRIAADEGLRTLGPRDPGHIELPGDLEALNREARRLGLGESVREGDRTIGDEIRLSESRPALGRVARPAPVARVAPVAPVARPGGVELDEPVQPAADDLALAATPAAEEGGRPAAASGDAAPGGGALVAGGAADASRAGGTERWVHRAGDGTPGLEMIRRIDQVEGASTRSLLRRVLIALDGADQTPAGHIRLDIRGERVDALFEVDSPTLARRLERDLATLRAQLTSEGVDPGRLRVRQTGTEMAIAAEARVEARVESSRSSAQAEAERQGGERGTGGDAQQRGLREQGRDYREGRSAPPEPPAEEDA